MSVNVDHWWPDFQLPPINLYTVPYQELYNEMHKPFTFSHAAPVPPKDVRVRPRNVNEAIISR